MKVTQVMICGMEHPCGYGYRKIKLSWKVCDTAGKYQEKACVKVSTTEDFKNLVYEKEGNLNSICEILNMELLPRTLYYVRVTVTGDNGETASGETTFETGKMNEPRTGVWVGPAQEDQYHPVVYKNFETDREVVSARLYVCGLGVYEAYINGEKVGDEYLAPFYNDYNYDLQYQTYDITSMLKADNKAAFILGNGWYKGRFGLGGGKGLYGDRFKVIAEIHVDYADGTHAVTATDKTWMYKGFDVADSGIYDGETYDRLLWEGRENPEKSVEVLGADTSKLVPRFSMPVRACEKLSVKELIHTPAGETVLDFGQNFTGFVQFESRLPKGTKVVLEYGEILQQGNYYNDNYRSAKPQFTYVSDGNPETVRPHFTFYGGRYVRVTGWKGDLNVHDFTGLAIHSDLKRTGFMETGHTKINQLISNCLWGQRSNFLDVPTDCPQRDERLGWTGDANVFSPTASYNMDTRAFYDKYLHDLRIAQLQLGGAAPHVAPLCGMNDGGSCVWGDAATFIPNVLYDYFGDAEVIETYYPLMKDWVDYIRRGDEANGNHYLFDYGFHFGDWLALDGATDQSVKGGTDDYYIASCYYYASAGIVSRAAGIIGNKEDEEKYAQLAAKIRQAILDEYFTKTGRLAIDTQTAYLVALKFGIFTDKNRIIEGLKNRFKRDCYRIRGGFVGATMMCTVLAENGLHDAAWHFLLNEDFPSWLHCVNLGATTIWERWNSVLDDGSISGTGMNSLNHYSYGSVLEYMYKYVAGICASATAFKSVCFKPQLNIKMGYMNCSYDSVSGRYVSNWKINGDGSVTMHFEVPFNCTATACLPYYDGEPLNMEAGSYDITYKPAKDLLKPFSKDSFLFELAGNEKAMDILKTYVPQAYGMVMSGDIENMAQTVEELKGMAFIGVRPERVDLVIDGISQIQAEL